MQQLITVRLDVSPLIYHQQSGTLSHGSHGRKLANTYAHRSCSEDALLAQSRSPDYPKLILFLSFAAVHIQHYDCMTDQAVIHDKDKGVYPHQVV